MFTSRKSRKVKNNIRLDAIENFYYGFGSTIKAMAPPRQDPWLAVPA
jgi:hypothetical protein